MIERIFGEAFKSEVQRFAYNHYAAWTDTETIRIAQDIAAKEGSYKPELPTLEDRCILEEVVGKEDEPGELTRLVFEQGEKAAREKVKSLESLTNRGKKIANAYIDVILVAIENKCAEVMRQKMGELGLSKKGLEAAENSLRVILETMENPSKQTEYDGRLKKGSQSEHVRS